MADTDVSAAGPAQQAQAPERDEGEARSIRAALRSAEIDSRLAGMLVALAIIWGVFQIITPNHTFLTPRNLWNLSVQSSVVAIMATGMVLIIVTREHRPLDRGRDGGGRHGDGASCSTTGSRSGSASTTR